MLTTSWLGYRSRFYGNFNIGWQTWRRAVLAANLSEVVVKEAAALL